MGPSSRALMIDSSVDEFAPLPAAKSSRSVPMVNGKRDVMTLIKSPDKIENYYYMYEQLGMGGFATVRKCQRVMRPVLHNAALKIVKKEKHFTSIVLLPDKEEYMERLLGFNHPNVTYYYDFLEDSLHAYVVMPMWTGPSLWQQMEDMPFISEKWTQRVMKQVLSALSYIHMEGVCHRDMTPTNIVYESPSSTTVKLIDFGCCALPLVESCRQTLAGAVGVVGTLPFIAPDAFDGSLDFPLDVWSAGVTMYTMLSGRFPFAGSNPDELLDSISMGVDLSLTPWPRLSSSARDIIMKMLLPHPMQRATAEQALCHEWFRAPRSETSAVPGSALKVLREKLDVTENRSGISSPARRGVVSQLLAESFPATPIEVTDIARSLARAISAPTPQREAVDVELAVRGRVPASAPVRSINAPRHQNIIGGYVAGRMPATMLASQIDLRVEGAGSPHGPVFSSFLTEWDATVATFSSIIGAAILSTPFAFKHCGLFAIPLMIGFTALTCFTAHLMAWTFLAQAPDADFLGITPPMRTWSYLADAAYGAKGRRFLAGFLVIELWGYVLSYTVVSSVHMNQVMPTLPLPVAVLISSIVTYLLTFAPASLLTRISVASNFVFLAACFLFVITGLFLPDKAPRSEFEFIKLAGLPKALGILVFNSASHACYPSIMNAMSNPSRYTSCIRQAYAAALIFYLLVAVPGYLCFGDRVQESLVENIGLDREFQMLPGLGWTNMFAAVGMVVKMGAMQPLVFSPLTDTIKFTLPGAIQKNSLLKVMLPVCVLAISVVASVLFADSMSSLINLIGSVLCMNIAFVMPVLFYCKLGWKLSGEKLGFMPKIGLVAIAVMGGCFAVLGVVQQFVK